MGHWIGVSGQFPATAIVTPWKETAMAVDLLPLPGIEALFYYRPARTQMVTPTEQ
jgi:hypothetical protein